MLWTVPLKELSVLRQEVTRNIVDAPVRVEIPPVVRGKHFELPNPSRDGLFPPRARDQKTLAKAAGRETMERTEPRRDKVAQTKEPQ